LEGLAHLAACLPCTASPSSIAPPSMAARWWGHNRVTPLRHSRCHSVVLWAWWHCRRTVDVEVLRAGTRDARLLLPAPHAALPSHGANLTPPPAPPLPPPAPPHYSPPTARGLLNSSRCYTLPAAALFHSLITRKRTHGGCGCRCCRGVSLGYKFYIGVSTMPRLYNLVGRTLF